ncbi:MAG: efflux RND transporter periplasmic adaptor subunit [Candidatus Eisenbacteria bacterium]
MKDGIEKKPGRGYSWKMVAILCIGATALIAIGIWGGHSIGKSEKAEALGGDHAMDQAGQAEIWTCSMHPQIRQPKPGKCPLCGMDLVPVTEAGAGDAGARELRLSPAAMKLAEIQTAAVERRVVAAEVRMAGKVDYDETRVSYITAWVPGRLNQMYIDYTGVAVEQGAPMVSIYSPELVVAQEELIQSVRAMENLQTSEVESLKRTARETLHAVREKLRLLGLTPDQISEIETRGTVSDEIVIGAPAGGVVVDKAAVEGQYVTTGTLIYTIADLTRVWVKLDAYESDLPWLRSGQDVEFTAEALPGETFNGEVAFIDPVLDPKTRTAKVRVNVENPGGRLKPAMFVRGVVSADVAPVGRAQAPLVIPASAPLITGKRAVVYLETEPGLYTGMEIVLGPRAGNFYVVEEGLEEGQRVVTNGNFKIDSAIQILAKPSMMNPEGGGPLPGHQHGGAGSSGSVAAGYHAEARFIVPAEFADQIARVYDSYLEIHHGLSRDSLENAKAAAKHLEARVGSVDMTLLGGAAHNAWMDYLGGLKAHAGMVRSAEDITAARSGFAPLSETMYAALKSFGAGGSTPVYRFHCSMAFGGSGANWLQSTREVENPYWGAAMFSCGEMTESVAAGSEDEPGEHHHE